MLQWIGGVLAGLGFGNLIYTPWITSGEHSLLSGLVINGMLFVVPGCVVYGIGVAMAIKHRKLYPLSDMKAGGQQRPVAMRLQELVLLREKGMISAEELDHYRKEILDEL